MLLPRACECLPLRHVLEPRHESFSNPAFFDLCRDHDAAIVFGDDDFPCINAAAASFASARLQRLREDIATAYDDHAPDAFAARARSWSSNARDSYLFMINSAKLRASAAALALQQRLAR